MSTTDEKFDRLVARIGIAEVSVEDRLRGWLESRGIPIDERSPPRRAAMSSDETTVVELSDENIFLYLWSPEGRLLDVTVHVDTLVYDAEGQVAVLD